MPPCISNQRMTSRRHYRVRPWTEYMEIYWGSREQAYVTPISSQEVCIAVMGDTAEDVDFDRALEDIPELRQQLSSAELCSRERGAVTAMQTLARVWDGNVALVGDASGGVDAITGEGLRLAFRQVLVALADAMERGDLREYECAHRQLARRPTLMGRLMLQLGQSVGIRSRVLRMLNPNPELFARLLAIHLGHSTPRDVVSTGAQLGWQFLAS
jgi:menaquinone-9 beta-reductase